MSIVGFVTATESVFEVIQQDLNRCSLRSRRRTAWWEFSARLFCAPCQGALFSPVFRSLMEQMGSRIGLTEPSRYRPDGEEILGLLTTLQPPLLVRSPRPPFCLFHSSCGKLPGVGTLNESPTNGPGVAGCGRGLRRGSNREGTGRLAINKGRGTEMKQKLRVLAAAGALLIAMPITDAAFAAKPGGILRVYHWDSPASMSIHEEATYSTVVPMMGVLITWSSTSRTNQRTAFNRSCRISRRVGRGARTVCT
jgi:hypothetical protein